ncbi:MAG: hypothetical protein V1745_00155 [Patescibacteria group bacterium]
MAEPLIHDSTPKGSAILAYGESPRRMRLPIILALAAGMIAVSGVVLFAVVTFSDVIPLPDTAISVMFLKTDAPLPAEAPVAWVEARTTAKPFPVLVGYRRDTDGTVQPYAIVPRCTGSGGVTSWAFRLLDDDATSSRTSLRSLAGSVRNLFAPSWLRIWPKRAFQDLSDAPDDMSIGGSLTLSTWKTDVKAPISGTTEDVGRNVLDLDTFPGAWTIVESSFRSRGLGLQLTERPKSASWSIDPEGRLTVLLAFHDDLSGRTKAEIAGSLGISSLLPTTLADGTPVNELTIDATGFETATSVRSDEGIEAVFTDAVVHIGPSDGSLEDIPTPKSCSGPILSAFDLDESREFLTSHGIPIFPGTPQRILWTTDTGKVSACW